MNVGNDMSVVTVGGPRPFTCASWPDKEAITAARVAGALGIPLDRRPIHIDRFVFIEVKHTTEPGRYLQPQKVKRYGHR